MRIHMADCREIRKAVHIAGLRLRRSGHAVNKFKIFSHTPLGRIECLQIFRCRTGLLAGGPAYDNVAAFGYGPFRVARIGIRTGQ